jgi:hypothetical protein
MKTTKEKKCIRETKSKIADLNQITSPPVLWLEKKKLTTR